MNPVVISTLAIMFVHKSESKACDSFFECQTDRDCWNGPGFRCVNTTAENGAPSVISVCVCGGAPISIPDGIPRNYSCRFDGYYTNGIRLCLIDPGSPCWPRPGTFENYVLDQGLSVGEGFMTRQALRGLRDNLCGDGICSETESPDGLFHCVQLGNYQLRVP